MTDARRALGNPENPAGGTRLSTGCRLSFISPSSSQRRDADTLNLSLNLPSLDLSLLTMQLRIAILLVALELANGFTAPRITTPSTRPVHAGCHHVLSARRRRSDDYDDFEDDDDYYNRRYDDLGDFQESRGLDVPSSYGRRDGWRLPDSVSKALLAGVFVLGVGLGVTLDSQVNTNPKDLASRDAIDQAAPNPTLCAKLGASAMAFDQRVFVSFNPFNVYVSQADVKPACVLREANVVPVLRGKGLINDDEVRACKSNMNTWAFVGNLEDTPQLSCVYKSQDAQNEFLSNPKIGIGEDYLDDARKSIKTTTTEGQKELQRKAALIPGFD